MIVVSDPFVNLSGYHQNFTFTLITSFIRSGILKTRENHMREKPNYLLNLKTGCVRHYLDFMKTIINK